VQKVSILVKHMVTITKNVGKCDCRWTRRLFSFLVWLVCVFAELLKKFVMNFYTRKGCFVVSNSI